MLFRSVPADEKTDGAAVGVAVEVILVLAAASVSDCSLSSTDNISESWEVIPLITHLQSYIVTV